MNPRAALPVLRRAPVLASVPVPSPLPEPSPSQPPGQPRSPDDVPLPVEPLDAPPGVPPDIREPPLPGEHIPMQANPRLSPTTCHRRWEPWMFETRYFIGLVQRSLGNGAADASGTGAAMHQQPR